MTNGPPKRRPPADKKEDFVLTPGGWRPKSKVHKVEPGQHVEVQEGRLKVIDSATGKIVADLGVVRKPDAEAPRRGGPMQKAKRPKSTK